MKKDVHIYLDYELSNEIEKIAMKNHENLSNTYTIILNYGLSMGEVLKKLDLIYKSLNRISYNLYSKEKDKMNE